MRVAILVTALACFASAGVSVERVDDEDRMPTRMPDKDTVPIADLKPGANIPLGDAPAPGKKKGATLSEEAVADLQEKILKKRAEAGKEKGEDGQESKDDGVPMLDSPEDFHQFLEEGPCYVEFYAPWCGHCKKLAPIWAQVKEALKDTEIIVAKVDATNKPMYDITKKYEIKGYPAVIFFKDGESFTFKGQRTLEALTAFAQRANGSISAGQDVKIRFKEYLLRLAEIHRYEPTALPFSLALGLMCGVVLGVLLSDNCWEPMAAGTGGPLQAQKKPTKPKQKKETKKTK